MTEKVLGYDRSIVPQEKGWDCGPAATQVVLNGLGIQATEDQLIREIGTTTNGTDYVGLIERVLDRRLPDARYTSVYLEQDPPTAAQKDALWRHIVQSINAGYGVVMNWVAPPGNKPRGVKGSQSPAYSGGTTYHYVACMGYDDAGERALWIADSGFRPFGYWISFDQATSLIPPKGYAYAAAGVVAPPAAQPPTAFTFAGNVKTILRVGKSMGVTPRGLKIGLATGLVESNIQVYANPKVPESMTLPHQAVGNDGFSVGIWQQQVVWGNGWWWGDAKTCMDPESSSRLFFERLLKLDYNNASRSPGSFAQAVQKSAYPDRYDARFGEAERLYDQYITQITTTDPIEELLMSGLSVPSLSIYADPDEPDVPIVDMIRALDAHGPHEPYVEAQARAGNSREIARVVRTAAGRGRAPYGTTPAAISQAKAVLVEIEAAHPEYLQTYLNGARS